MDFTATLPAPPGTKIYRIVFRQGFETTSGWRNGRETKGAVMPPHYRIQPGVLKWGDHDKIGKTVFLNLGDAELELEKMTASKAENT